jgi:hypothetical protein
VGSATLISVSQLILGEVDVTLPENALVTGGASPPRMRRYRVTGPGVAEVRARVIEAATAVGYTPHRRSKVVTLVRGRQRIVLRDVDALELSAAAYSLERIPAADLDVPGIALGRFWISLPGARFAKRPAHETVPPAGTTAVWEVFGKDASEVSSLVLVSLAAHGLLGMGPLVPRDASIGDTWSSDAANLNTLVKVYATQEADCVVLKLVLIDDEPIDDRAS